MSDLLSIIIPAYNEAERLPVTLESVFTYLAKTEHPAEIIVVNDGSTDTTHDVIMKLSERHENLKEVAYAVNRGKGYAIAHGMKTARGAYRVFMDADNSTQIQEFEKAAPLFAAGADVVIGSRALPGSVIAVHQPWWREIPGRLANGTIRMLTRLPFRDTQCGFKCFTARAAEAIFAEHHVNRWACDVEMLVRAERLGYRIQEIPVEWRNDRGSKVRLSSYIETFREVMFIRNIYKKKSSSRLQH